MTLISGLPFTQLLNLNILGELRIDGVIVNPSGGEDITRVSADYTQEIDDDIIIMTGDNSVTLIDVSTAIKRITIASNASTITLIPNGTDTSAVTTILPNTTTTLIPNLTGWLGG